MRFLETRLAGTFLIEQERHANDRGFFARSRCAERGCPDFDVTRLEELRDP